MEVKEKKVISVSQLGSRKHPERSQAEAREKNRDGQKMEESWRK